MNHEYNSTIKNLCLTEINYMNQEKYNKIDKLYNAYYICNFYISKKNESRSCSYAKYCASAYNNIMTEYIKKDDIKFCQKLKELKDFLKGNEPAPTPNCDLSFSGSLHYPYYCNELLKEKEKPDKSMETSNVGPEVQGALGGQSEEQRQGISKEGSHGVREPGVRASAIGEPEGGTKMQETVNLMHTPADHNVISADSPSAKTHTPVGTIIGTSLGFVLPLITIYRV
ncbi:hypothetical protein PVNG_06445 [Plasmodium vivax North Korean]|uniref:Uncharacterized protein n=1 Tax=Plasmodium vivax North Korean TaxID=1035514 RepID=A0A0J9TNS1_PLAVI|nr:hypothetical protein PVNG_06445 [Plasmodium vivax North Korean]